MRSMEDLNLFDCISDNLSNEVIAFVKNKIV
jgi:hypothetical protein